MSQEGGDFSSGEIVREIGGKEGIGGERRTGKVEGTTHGIVLVQVKLQQRTGQLVGRVGVSELE